MMDRHNILHKASRVSLPDSLSSQFQNAGLERGMMSEIGSEDTGAGFSRLAHIIARLGLLTSSLAVIATASLLALHVG